MRANDQVGSGCRGFFARQLLKLIALTGLAPLAPDALATCSQFAPPPELYVGDTDSNSPTYDAACSYDTIQKAIDAATCIYGTKIFVTHEVATSGVPINISNKNVTLIGRTGSDKCGPASIVICGPVIGCAPPPTAPLAVVGGADGASVITISGTSHVYIQYLEIANPGKNANGNGGGIDFDGSGSLTLDTSWVGNNHATNGGGIYFNGTGANTSTLTVLAHTEIFGNTADGNGGGILVSGNAELDILEPDTQINANHAPNGQGGGIDVLGPASANIGSPDTYGLSVINGNDAAYGGGIAITTPDAPQSDSIVRLFSTDGTPVGITNNTASHTGGGIYLHPYVESENSSGAVLYAWDFHIDGNTAAEGTAIYADVATALFSTDLSGLVLLSDPSVAFPADLGAVACTDSNRCNTLNGNLSSNGVGSGSGATILIQDGGNLVANHFSMRDNHGPHAIRIVGDYTGATLSNCLIAGNQMDHELIYLTGNATPMFIGDCTLADDTIGATHVIHTESNLDLADDIIYEPGTLALDYSGDPAKLVVNYILTNDITTLPGTAVIPGVPEFADAAGGDYHLKPTSLGIDFAPSTGTIDLDGNPRNVDLPSPGNVFGSHDLGAYELQNGFHSCGAQDSLFCDGFNY